MPKEDYLMKAIDAKGGITPIDAQGGIRKASKMIVWRARGNLGVQVIKTRIAQKFYISFCSNYFSALEEYIAELLKVVLGSGYGMKIEI